ncbi:hypothetical protein E4U42_002359 [Claviceps africana]|uniref:Uncharacterized protein n=1 Tax=Claviceps africana TaxID=83212 RepID=A0A8K0JAT1_9HYPO|nr:hypothetical protein E4U42_002359 [Claviceps africana]
MPDQGSPAPQAQPGAASSRNPAAASKSTGFAPPGHALRRSKTVDDGPSPMQRRSHASRSEASNEGLPHDGPRRSSNFSEYNLDETTAPESSPLPSLSLAFALLPAIAGALFKDGHVVVTDIMLLALSGVFLHWSVTQPWVWYHSARQVRIQKETGPEDPIDYDLETDDSGLDTAQQHKSTGVDPVPGGAESVFEANDKSSSEQEQPALDLTTPQQRSALRELYFHETSALLSCFALPFVSAGLLHYIRVQLSRPSEGLVSNYNLTIFLLVSELRACSHTIKLVKSRTLHLQQVVHGNPFATAAQPSGHMEEMLERLERLEARSLADEFVREHSEDMRSSAATEQKASLAKDVRKAIQPELDALNRAVRRYEKKATLLQHQTDARFSVLDSRLDDAIALAAVAAKNSSSKNMFVSAFESLIAVVLFPFVTLLQVFTLPLRSILGLFNSRKKNPVPARQSRLSRAGKQYSSQPRYSGDRVPPRVMKR